MLVFTSLSFWEEDWALIYLFFLGGPEALLVSSIYTYLHICISYPRLFLPIARRVFAISVTLLIGLCLLVCLFFCFLGGEEPIKVRLEYICHSMYIVRCSSKVREFPVT